MGHVPAWATTRTLAATWSWVVEPKLDGWRAPVYVDENLCVRTRRGRVVTESVPELRGLVEEVPGARPAGATPPPRRQR